MNERKVLWASFAAAAAIRTHHEDAAEIADAMLKLMDERFPEDRPMLPEASVLPEITLFSGRF